VFTDLPLDFIGLLSGMLLFLRHPVPRKGMAAARGSRPRVSVIIPARNEADALPSLLASLAVQSLPPIEIICVDDESADGTAEAARLRGASVVPAGAAPAHWLGKPWACSKGADAATGDILLFLDADVSLGPRAIERLLGELPEAGGAVSLQPYHEAEKPYEQFSLFFNLLAVGGNGLGLPWKVRSAGLFGPVIMMDRASYEAIGGHGAVKDEVAEDLAMGRALRRKGIPYRLFLGDGVASYRMYRRNYADLRQGWTKNMAIGASKASPLALLLAFAWIAAGASIVVDLCLFASRGDLPMACLAACLYAWYALLLGAAASRIGRFRKSAFIAYPVLLSGFIVLFLESLFLRWILKRVSWKGRRIDLGGRP
jgi:4,4'-diaponeurosporenoate glycosyltransferase